ncbi:TPA: hypothetical protein NPP81_003945, partial [Klebsiella quasipneumoniae subsp. quasipneumoniae]|nr:hypothetical protein [Klebsiella quasipneumoniae subsp. quasipneumoniae]
MALTLKEKGSYRPSVVLRNLYFRYFCLFLLSGVVTKTLAAEESNEANYSDYIFDPSLFKGGNFDHFALERLVKPDSIVPGFYKVDVYVNNNFVGNYPLHFMANGDKVLPCLSFSLISDIGFRNVKTNGEDEKAGCLFLNQITSSATEKIEISTFKYSIIIPQALLNIKPRGYVNPDNYDTGANIGFVNYLANYYHVSYSDDYITNQDSAWLSLNGGLN